MSVWPQHWPQYRLTPPMPTWVQNMPGPRLWCRLAHRDEWWSNDFGTWWTSGRNYYEVLCLKCGDCWTWPHPARGKGK